VTFNPYALIELWVVLAFVLAWLVLEWQGRRLDRRRAERERRDVAKAEDTQSGQESTGSGK
jgi:hypothetical protein